jgi:hypothetical protein
MELKKLREHWASFPAMSMEERPVLTSEMEKMLVKNPFTKDFYLRNKILAGVITGMMLLLITLYQISSDARGTGKELYSLLFLACTLAGFIAFHLRLLFFADYPSLASLSLIPFLARIETIFHRYIQSFKIVSLLAGFYLQTLLEWMIRNCSANVHQLIWQNDVYRVLLIAFLSISTYIALLHFRINKYKKLRIAVRSYKEGISETAKKH